MKENFSAHDQALWRGDSVRLDWNAQGDRSDGLDIGGDIVALLAVATGRRAREHAIFVGDDDGKTIEFRLQDVAQLCIRRQEPQIAFLPGAQIGGVKGVGQAENRGRVLNFGEVTGQI